MKLLGQGIAVFSRLLRLVRGGRFYVFLAGLWLLTIPAGVRGQFKFREPPNRQEPAALGELEGLAIWEAFRMNRALGEFELSGTLHYRPPASSSRRYTLMLSGDWRSGERVTTIHLWGPEGEARVTRIREEEDGDDRRVYWKIGDNAEEEIGGEALQKDLLPALPLSIADLLMEYLSWPDPEYVGPKRYLGRPAHVYRLANPEESGEVFSAEVWLDEDFAAVLRIELRDGEGDRVRMVRVGGFEEFADGWMFSKLVWEDRESRASFRFDVREFSLQSPSS